MGIPVLRIRGTPCPSGLCVGNTLVRCREAAGTLWTVTAAALRASPEGHSPAEGSSLLARHRAAFWGPLPVGHP